MAKEKKTLPLSVRLPADLVHRAAQAAREQNSTVTALVGQGLHYIVEKHRIARSREYQEFLKSLEDEATLEAIIQRSAKLASVATPAPEASSSEGDPILGEGSK